MRPVQSMANQEERGKCMKFYGVVNGAGTAYYSSGYTYMSRAKIALDYALQHDPKAHIVEYECKTQAEQIEELIAELKQVKRERDAATEDIKKVVKTNRLCCVCKHDKQGLCMVCGDVPYDAVVICEQFKWRGVEVEHGT